ncbi:iron complex transport system permease protein [Pseudonocardia sediminis]|uniref:Iron complex transport system permease protein n=1 Tax=Pseudonocardia sediminis TaxID=1397368 RepID=A0A4Q7UY11_PSEST|nr:iron chelate uptake ABC transporter family permease subunit [Pseudonocardia sediminis]RZT85093.1 iron complex transport system permease protein [Pseudonocardia sediminis]
MSAPAPAASAVTVAGRPALRWRGLSGVWRPRMLAVTAAGLVLLVLAVAVNVGRGDFPIPLGDVLAALAGGGTRGQQFVVWQLRLPRSLTGALVGAALGIGGAITQTVARNPLASPDILGVTAGAGTAAVVVIVLGGGSSTVALSAAGLPLASLAGGLLTAGLVYGLAWRRGIDGYRLVLVGVGVGAAATAVTSWLLIAARIGDAARATVWLTGSLNARGWENVVPVSIALLVLVPVALLLAFGLGALQFGDDTATALGVRVNVARSALIVLAVALTAVATASAGPIAFVALVVPQICLRLVGAPRPPLLASAVYGGLLVVVSDLIARTVLPAELPVGIVTAAIGAPYLIWLLVRGRSARV